MLNEKVNNLINEIKDIFSRHYVNKEEIQNGFDRYFEGIKLPKRRVEFCSSGEYLPLRIVSLDDILINIRDFAWRVARNTAWANARAYDWVAARGAALKVVRDTAWFDACNIIWSADWNIAWNIVLYAACLNSCNKNDNCPICEFRRKFCEPEYNLFKNGVFAYCVLKDRVIVVTRPIIRQVDGRLHSETQPAVEWETEKYYLLWGVKLNKDLWQKIVSKTLSFKEIMSIQNIEQRMVALKMMDAEKLLKESKAKLLHKSERGNELYLVENIFSQPAYFLKYKCPSTGRVYVSGIDPRVAKQNPDADFCMSWKLGLTLDEYLNNLKIET